MGLDITSSFFSSGPKFFLSHVASLEAVWNIANASAITLNNIIEIVEPLETEETVKSGWGIFHVRNQLHFSIMDNQSKIKRINSEHYVSISHSRFMNEPEANEFWKFWWRQENKLRERACRKLELMNLVQGVKLWTKIGSTERWHMLIEIDFVILHENELNWTNLS